MVVFVSEKGHRQMSGLALNPTNPPVSVPQGSLIPSLLLKAFSVVTTFPDLYNQMNSSHDSETLGASGRPLYNVDSEFGRFLCHWAFVPFPAFIFSSRKVFYHMVFIKFDDTVSWYLAVCIEVNPRNTLARVNSIKTEAA